VTPGYGSAAGASGGACGASPAGSASNGRPAAQANDTAHSPDDAARHRQHRSRACSARGIAARGPDPMAPCGAGRRGSRSAASDRPSKHTRDRARPPWSWPCSAAAPAPHQCRPSVSSQLLSATPTSIVSQAAWQNPQKPWVPQLPPDAFGLSAVGQPRCSAAHAIASSSAVTRLAASSGRWSCSIQTSRAPALTQQCRRRCRRSR
jgi:hypothetical protein